jgi:hypothetical protein
MEDRPKKRGLGQATENTYLLVTVMAIFARQYEPMLAMAWVDAEDDIGIWDPCSFGSG